MHIQENNNNFNGANKVYEANLMNPLYQTQSPVTYAGFFVRLAAYIIDIIIVKLALSTLRVPMWIVSMFNPDFFLFKPILFDFSLWNIILYLLSALYFILLTYFKGATVGKYLLRLNVVSDLDGEKIPLLDVIYRETIGRYLSGLLFIGYFFIGASSDKRALHDILCNTHVIYS